MSNKRKLSALSRTVIRDDHALITGDGFVNSKVPGWTDCIVNVVISEAIGADFAQLLTTMNPNSKIAGTTDEAQIFFYVLEGECRLKLNGRDPETLKKGSYLYVPVQQQYELTDGLEGTKLLSFHKEYEYLEDTDAPAPVTGHQSEVPQNIYEGDEGLLMQNLLPDAEDMAFDMSINIFTYMPGAHLPFVETHIMEHGLMYLQGQGIYRLADQWYPVQKGDSIWMAPYCPQWFVAIGKEPAVYIYYKDVNRFPTVV